MRENIVRFLEAAALHTDAPALRKARVIRDRAVIRTLLVEGFAKDDAAADLAADILQHRVMPSDLFAFSDIYADALRRGNTDYLYLAAKAKAINALPFVNKLARRSRKESRDEMAPERLRAVNIAQAALGNAVVEREFIEATLAAERSAPPAPPNRFFDVGAARDGTDVARHIHELGLIGTPRTLKLACRFLRSPLKSYVPDISERSIRHAALAALRYNYPDEQVLADSTDDRDWPAAEQFCVRTLGVGLKSAYPDIPRDLVYPTHIRERPSGVD